MARDKKKKDDEPGIPAWVVTYGDMMSLLLTFFVLLLSFSTVSEKDFNQAMMSLQGAFGVLDAYSGIINPVPRPPKKAAKRVERIAREIQRKMMVQGKEEDVNIELDKKGGLKIVLPNQVLFASGSATLKPEAFDILASVGNVLEGLQTGYIDIRGHTDSRPLSGSGRFEDNWHLSYARARSVMMRLSATSNLPEGRYQVVACGPSQPVDTNETEQGRQANRRVEIHVRGVEDSANMDEVESQLSGQDEEGSDASFSIE
ncbi:MAG: OmpA family protein [Nitrospiraceae bacterium]|nr:OmpA family protein [Nitrospiraceae bacterium]